MVKKNFKNHVILYLVGSLVVFFLVFVYYKNIKSNLSGLKTTSLSEDNEFVTKQDEQLEYPQLYKQYNLPEHPSAKLISISEQKRNWYGVELDLELKLETTGSEDEGKEIYGYYQTELLKLGWKRHKETSPGRAPDAFTKNGLYYQYTIGRYPNNKIEITIKLGRGEIESRY